MGGKSEVTQKRFKKMGLKYTTFFHEQKFKIEILLPRRAD